MQHSHNTSWFLRDPSDGGPTRDQSSPRIDPDLSDSIPQPNSDGDSEGDHDRRAESDPQPQRRQSLHPRNSHPPPSGFRIPLASNAEFPSPQQIGPRACVDANGVSAIYIGSAILEDSIHPCKIAPSVHPLCRVPYEGSELHHHGRFDLLPITPDMEWVPTTNGEIPPGRRPIEGGYDSGGAKFYHALGDLDGVDVPGKTGIHLVS